MIPKVGEPGSPEAAVAVIIGMQHKQESVLFIKRTERQGDPWSGQIALPGGRRSTSDRNFRETAIRETKEEVGIDLRNHELLGVLRPMFARTRRMLVAPFVFELKSQVDIRSNEEVAESFWISLSHLATVTPSRVEVDTLDGPLTTDGYVCNDRVIWGLTFRIIIALLGKQPAI